MSDQKARPQRDGKETSPSGEESDLERKLTEYAKLGLPVATVVLAVVGGAVQGPAFAILMLAGGALIAVIAVFWSSVRTLVGETPLSGADAYALGAPRAEEEQKRAVLRALKDLEFERSVGKISEEDYQALVTKYRAEAKRLLRLLDAEAQPRRAHVETLVQRRLRREGLLEASDNPEAPEEKEEQATEGEDEDARSEADEASAVETSAVEAKAPVAEAKAKTKKRKKARADKAATKAEIVCAACGTANDGDAVFCKKCGARQAPAASEANESEMPKSEEGAS